MHTRPKASRLDRDRLDHDRLDFGKNWKWPEGTVRIAASLHSNSNRGGKHGVDRQTNRSPLSHQDLVLAALAGIGFGFQPLAFPEVVSARNAKNRFFDNG